tara:strand:+ start:31501 stop:31740 length:240 start_codon:yes stop_codon:yes gene_type:complete
VCKSDLEPLERRDTSSPESDVGFDPIGQLIVCSEMRAQCIEITPPGFDPGGLSELIECVDAIERGSVKALDAPRHFYTE